MGGVRRLAVALAVALAWLGSAGIVMVATATPSASLTCTDSWVGPNSGTPSWNGSTSYWSTNAFPTSSDVACVNEARTYSVLLTSSASVSALQVGGASGGTQGVVADGAGGGVDLSMGGASTVESGGTLTLESGASGNATVSGTGSMTVASGGTFSTEGSDDNVYIQVPVTNQSGTVTIGAASTVQNTGTLDSNAGSFRVANSGQLALSSSSGLTDTATGTLGVTVNGTAATGGIRDLAYGDRQHAGGHHGRLAHGRLDVHADFGTGVRHVLEVRLR